MADEKQHGLCLKLTGLIELCRPLNCLITAIVVWIGGVLAGSVTHYSSISLMLAAFSASLIAAGGNVYNDVKDREIDRINHPDRPIPSGRVTIKIAGWWAMLLTLSGILVGGLISYHMAIIALITAGLLLDYNERRSRTLIVGNIIIALCAGLAFVYGAVAVGNPVGGVLPGVFAMLIHLGREIVKDVEDIEGDSALGAMTLPIVRGGLFAQRFAAAILIFLVIFTAIPLVYQQYSDRYFYLMIPLVNIPLVLISLSLFRKQNKRGLHNISTLLKGIMLSGLIVLFFSR